MAGFWWLLFGVDERGGMEGERCGLPHQAGRTSLGEFQQRARRVFREIVAIQVTLACMLGFGRRAESLVSLVAVELSDGLSHTLAMSRARWRLSSLVRRSLKTALWGKTLVQMEPGLWSTKYERVIE